MYWKGLRKEDSMDALLDALVMDDVIKVNSILSSLESKTVDRASDEDSITFSTQDLQDAFVQAAFSGSIKSLTSLSKYGKNISNAFMLSGILYH